MSTELDVTCRNQDLEDKSYKNILSILVPQKKWGSDLQYSVLSSAVDTHCLGIECITKDYSGYLIKTFSK